MEVGKIIGKIDCLFSSVKEEIYKVEAGLTYDGGRDVKKIGYCVNLTLETVEQAKNKNVEMIITHHDAWEEIYGLKEACHKKLEEYRMSHYYAHLPLDDCDFGTNDSFLKKMKLQGTEKTHPWEGLWFGRIGEWDEPMKIEKFTEEMEEILGEPVKCWQFGKTDIQKIGLVCGNGGSTECMKESIERGCDTYITGESNLYTIQYAQLMKINLIVGSHTFTEFFGIEGLAMKIKEAVSELEIVPLNERHWETLKG